VRQGALRHQAIERAGDAQRPDRRARFRPGALTPADAAALAATLLPAPSPATAAALAAEARGHPLFVMELARAWRRHEARAVTQLGDALARRVDALDDDARAVIKVVGAAGLPVAQAVVAEAAGVALGPLAAVLVRLRDDLRRCAAEQLLRSGHVDAGLEALAEMLAGVGLRLPATTRAAIPSLVAARAHLRLRGLRLRRGRSLDPGALARVDACWSAAAGLLMIDSVRAAAFQSRMLRLALDAGDSYRASLALSLEAGLIASRGAQLAPRVAEILDQARALAAACGEPHAHGIVAAAAGISAYLQGRFAEGLAASEEAERILCTSTGVTWERDPVAAQTSWAQIYLGRFAALDARVPEVIRDAEERDDRYLATALRTGTLVWIPLVRGDTAGARIALDEGIRRWSERRHRPRPPRGRRPAPPRRPPRRLRRRHPPRLRPLLRRARTSHCRLRDHGPPRSGLLQRLTPAPRKKAPSTITAWRGVLACRADRGHRARARRPGPHRGSARRGARRCRRAGRRACRRRGRSA
jgi:hypothetical protein